MLNRSCIYIYTYTYFPSPRGTRKIKFQVFQKSSGFWSPWMLSPLEFSEKTQVFNIEPSMAMLAKPGVLERLPPTPLPLTAPWAEPATTAEIPTWKLASLRYSPRSIWQILKKKQQYLLGFVGLSDRFFSTFRPPQKLSLLTPIKHQRFGASPPIRLSGSLVLSVS